MSRTTAPPTMIAPAPNTAIPWSTRTEALAEARDQAHRTQTDGQCGQR